MLDNIVNSFKSPDEVLFGAQPSNIPTAEPKEEEKRATAEITVTKAKHECVMVTKGGCYQIGCLNCGLATDLHTDQIACHMEWQKLLREQPNCYIKEEKWINLMN